MNLTPPQKLTDAHHIAAFDCGEPSINQFLLKRALKNQFNNFGKAIVTCEGNRVVGYYIISMAKIHHIDAIRRIKQNAPDPVPMCLMGRLGVDSDYQGRGIGDALVKDFFLRGLALSGGIGMKGFLVHALNEEAQAFWIKWGLKPSPGVALTMMITIEEVKKSLPLIDA